MLQYLIHTFAWRAAWIRLSIVIPLQSSIASFSPSSLQLFITTFMPSSLHLLLQASSDFSLNGISTGQSTPRCGATLIYCVFLCVHVHVYVYLFVSFHVCAVCILSKNWVLLHCKKYVFMFFVCQIQWPTRRRSSLIGNSEPFTNPPLQQ